MPNLGDLVMFEESWLFPGPWRVVAQDDSDGVLLFEVQDPYGENIYVSDYEFSYIGYLGLWWVAGFSNP